CSAPSSGRTGWCVGGECREPGFAFPAPCDEARIAADESRPAPTNASPDGTGKGAQSPTSQSAGGRVPGHLSACRGPQIGTASGAQRPVGRLRDGAEPCGSAV